MLSLIVAEDGSRFEVFRGNKAPMAGTHDIWAHMGTYWRQTRSSRVNNRVRTQGSLGEGRGNRNKSQEVVVLMGRVLNRLFPQVQMAAVETPQSQQATQEGSPAQ